MIVNDALTRGIWLTGLSGAGKSTLAAALEEVLLDAGREVRLVDGDRFRKGHCPHLGFSMDDRLTNLRMMADYAAAVAADGPLVIVAAIAPYAQARRYARSLFDRFCEIYVNCPLDVCAARDPKGLYAKVKAGQIKGFTGVDDPYEAPTNPDILVRTDLMSLEKSVRYTIGRLAALAMLGDRETGPYNLPLAGLGIDRDQAKFKAA